MFASHSHWHMLGANRFIVRGIEADPALAGDIDFGPRMRGAVLAFTHLNIASDKSRPKSPMPRRLHHEDRIVPAGSCPQKECLAR